MASNRHLGRIIALQTLYECEFREQCEDQSANLQEILARNIDRYKETVDDTAFIERLVDGVHALRAKLDGLIQPIAPEWPIDQIARVDRTILRMALYELTETPDTVPPKVVINEAVELAKAFGSDNSSKFVNGVLGTAYRTLVEDKSEDNLEDKTDDSPEGKTEDSLENKSENDIKDKTGNHGEGADKDKTDASTEI